ncbi:MAG TPA: hypothetical protein VES00_03480 [Burkholderiaceae bacterium]|jgi:hypothetical protein|nr:hypothetical protein [Burkholderiaceae bacterium]
MNAKLKLIVMTLIGGLGFAIWSGMAYFEPAMRGDYSHFVIVITTGVIGLALREMRSNVPDAPAPAAAVPPPALAPATSIQPLPPLPPAV